MLDDITTQAMADKNEWTVQESTTEGVEAVHKLFSAELEACPRCVRMPN